MITNATLQKREPCQSDTQVEEKEEEAFPPVTTDCGFSMDFRAGQVTWVITGFG